MIYSIVFQNILKSVSCQIRPVYYAAKKKRTSPCTSAQSGQEPQFPKIPIRKRTETLSRLHVRKS